MCLLADASVQSICFGHFCYSRHCFDRDVGSRMGTVPATFVKSCKHMTELQAHFALIGRCSTKARVRSCIRPDGGGGLYIRNRERLTGAREWTSD